MTLTKKQLVTFLQHRFPRSFKTKELARSLDLPKQGDDYQRLKAMLHDLHEEGLVERVEGRKWGARPADPPVIGSIEIMEKGFGVVTTREAPPREIHVSVSRLNGAVHGAEVELRILPVSRGRRAEGEVTRVLHVPTHVVTGTVRRIRDRYFIEPDGKWTGDVFLAPGRTTQARDGDKVVVEVTEPAHGGHPSRGMVQEVLGRSGAHDVEMVALARRYQLTPVFPRTVEDEAAAIPGTIGREELAGRLDLRGQVCFTIDPETAKDFDDAVSIDIDADGNHVLGVHIADVSHFVPEGSALDREAERRGTSVYLMDTVVPMFPERLSNHLCSLKPDVDRLTFSVILTVSPRGAVKSYEAGKSVIHSRKRFSYPEAEEVIRSGSGPHAAELVRMNSLARVLTRKRHREGSIDFDVPEVRFEFDSQGRPVDIMAVERLQSMRLIEEFMLLANRTVAGHFAGGRSEAQQRPFLYRVHDAPDPERVNELLDFLHHLGIPCLLEPTSSRSFQRLLESVDHLPEKNVIHDVTIRAMAKAVYSEQNIGHFGLSFARYTHFTSPIRRYPDLVVHRLLHADLQGGSRRGPDVQRLADIARHSSLTERVAMEAEREALKIKQAEYMRRHLGDELPGVISGVTQFGIFVKLLPSLVEGLVHVKDIDDDYYSFDQRRRSLIGRRHGRVYRLGDAVVVRVVRVDTQAHRIDFLLVGHEEHRRH